MEEDNLILKKWLQQKDIFIKNLLNSRKLPTKDSVHDLRVTIKRMRSYLRFNEEFTKEDWRSSFSEIKELFRSFGRLRDFDMSLELCRKYERQLQIVLPAFKQYLTVNRKLTRRWAKLAAITFNEQQQVFNFHFDFFKGLQQTEIVDKIITLSNEKIKRTKRLKKHLNKNAHEIRKQLKDVLYWLKTCPKEVVESLIDVRHLDSALKYLGSWQDQYIFKRKLKQYVKELAGKDEKEILTELEKRSNADQKEFLEKTSRKLVALEKKKPAVMIQSI